jgi:dolichol-phosphate mannosyltransferase
LESHKKNNSCPYLSIVSAVYQAEALVDELVSRLKSNISPITEKFEIILVEDGSPDGSWKKIEENCKKDPRVRGIKLSRNFGQHFAITAGLGEASGEWIVVMDCDLQDRPEEIEKLLRAAENGYEIVLASRTARTDGLIKCFFSRFFYRILSFLSGTRYDSTVANFGVYHQRVIESILKMPERIRFFPAMVNWVGYTKTMVPVEHAIRPEGKSSYTFTKQLKLAVDIMLAYSDRPLRLIIALGLMISFLAFVLGGIIFYRYLKGQINVVGYASLITSICFFSGIIVSVLGVIGLYIGKIFDGIKNRPSYLVTKKLNPNGQNGKNSF